MGGIGKTTLAQEVFKRITSKFGSTASVFLPNVRVDFDNYGPVYLQKHLCKVLLQEIDANIQNVDMGIHLLGHRLHYKKVLIVLDDVDTLKQIEDLIGTKNDEQNGWLGPGSRVIITTRNEQLLKAYGVHHIYKVKKLSDCEAFQLLCLKAFKKNDAPSGYKNVSSNVVKYASGLPLALKVLGSELCGRNVDEWSEALVRLDEDPEKSILGALKISFDGLKDTEKKIFLDIACFFRGEDQERVEKILKSCGFYPKIGIRALIDKSLITIERKKLWMHDLLQHLGWHIVRQEFLGEPGKRSRLWHNEDARLVLTENTGTNAVEGLFLSLRKNEKIHLTADPFSKMQNLRFLMISNVNFTPCLELFPKTLRVLEWHGCPLESLPSSFQASRLVVLKMPNSQIKQLWNQRHSTMEMLILLDLSDCQFLTKTPDFTKVPNLEGLILKGCRNLSEVHPTAGDLQHLTLLNLKGCGRLVHLPHSISRLKSLETLILSGCSKLNLNQFQDALRNLKSLSQLYLDDLAVRELPISIQELQDLSLLSLRDCKNLLTLPSFICSLKSLKFLNLSGCSGIEELPHNLGEMESLEELDLSKTAIRKFPRSIVHLKHLKLLFIRAC